MEFKHGREVGTIIPDDDCYRFDSERMVGLVTAKANSAMFAGNAPVSM